VFVLLNVFCKIGMTLGEDFYFDPNELMLKKLSFNKDISCFQLIILLTGF
jgi:hypothetical protein